MKKDIECIKDKLFEIAWEENKSQYLISLEDVYEVIDQLDEPEVLSQEWINEHAKAVTYDGIPDQTEIVYVDELENLIIPKQEITEEQVMNWLDKNDFYDHITAETVLERAVDKGELSYYGTKYSVIETPTIPKCVADWWGTSDYVCLYGGMTCRKENKFDLISLFHEHGLEDYLWKVEDWIDNNKADFIDIVNGKSYKVEEEQKYYALVKGHELITDEGDLTCKYWNFNTSNGDVFPSNRFPEYGKFLIEMSKAEWNKLGINDSNADFVKVDA